MIYVTRDREASRASVKFQDRVLATVRFRESTAYVRVVDGVHRGLWACPIEIFDDPACRKQLCRMLVDNYRLPPELKLQP